MRYRKSAHAIYKTEYHLVWIPRYRRKIFVRGVKEYAAKTLAHIPELDPDSEVIKLSVQIDHVHMVIVVPPRIAVVEPFKPEMIEKIADNLVKIGVGVVLLTGGEPFLRDDIDDIVRIFKQKKLDVRMQTAGLYEKRDKIAKCVEYGARDINVSLDSLDENLSDFINGRTGSWRKALKTISFISNVFPQKDSICALGCVLSRYNIDEIIEKGIGDWKKSA